MSSSVLYNNVFQAKIGNVQNQADSSSVYSNGIWSFKNSTALTSVTITDSGNVGIGTDSPAAMNSATLAVVGSQGIAYQRSTNNQFGPTLDWFKSRGSFSAPTIVQNNDGLYTLRVVPFQGSSFTTLNMHAVEIDGTFSSGQNPPTRQVWYTNTANGNSTERMRIDSSGNISVGSGGANANNFVFNYTGGAVRPSGDNNQNFGLSTNRWANIFAGNGTIQTSDERLKKNIVPLPSMLGKVLQLKPSSWESKYDSYFVGSSGFIAQELEQVFPNLVQTQPETVEGHENIKTISVAGAEMVAILVKAIQELSAKVDAQAEEIKALKAQP